MSLRPNIIVVVLDTARADAFEPYGAPEGSSPVVADLARDGTAVPHAYASGSWTVPSHVGMFTGRLARAVGLGQAPDGTFRSTRPQMEALRDELLPEVLRQAGYATAGVSCNAWMSPTGGWDIGFEDFTHVPSRRGRPGRAVSLRTMRWLRELVAAELDNGAREAEVVVRRWFDEWDPSRPFFFFVNLMECHGPYLPPRSYNDLGVVQRVLAGVDSRRHQTFEAVLRQNTRGVEASEAALRRMRHLYGRSIRVLDDWLDRLLDLLETKGILDDTLLVLTSDHGENFGEANLIGHGMSLDDRLVHVPLVVRGPASWPGAGTWSLLGLPALLADAAGLTGHPFEPFEEGRPAVAQFDPFATADDPRVATAREKWDLDDEQVRRLTEPLTMVTDGRGKLVRQGETTWYHDLGSDTEEVKRLDPGLAPVALQQALAEEWLWEAGKPEPADVADDTDPDEVDALEAQMRLLGYM